MGGIFNIDGPVMRFLGKVADLMILNILTMICCIPVITVGASLTALHYMTLKIVRGEEGSIVKGYFKSFRQNFKQATVIWLLLVLSALILVGDFYIMKNSGIEFHIALKVIIAVIGVAIVFTATYVFPVLAKFDNTIMNTIRNAFFMSLLQIPKTILIIVVALVPVVVLLFFPQHFPWVFVFGMSVPSWVMSKLCNKFFKNLEDKVEAAETPEAPAEGEEDERIFKDELDETLILNNIERQ